MSPLWEEAPVVTLESGEALSEADGTSASANTETRQQKPWESAPIVSPEAVVANYKQRAAGDTMARAKKLAFNGRKWTLLSGKGPVDLDNLSEDSSHFKEHKKDFPEADSNEAFGRQLDLKNWYRLAAVLHGDFKVAGNPDDPNRVEVEHEVRNDSPGAGDRATQLFSAALRGIKPEDRPRFLAVMADYAQGRNTPERSFIGKVSENLQRGQHEVGEAFTGSLQHFSPSNQGGDAESDAWRFLQQVQGIRRGLDPVTSQNLIARGLLGAAHMTPAMGGSTVAGAAGGPRAATAFWVTQTAPHLFEELRDNGVEQSKAKGLAAVMSVPIAAIENLQFSQLSKPIADEAKQVAAKTLRQYLVHAAAEGGKTYSKELAEEGLQNGLEVATKAMAGFLDKNAPGVDWKKEWGDWKNSMAEAALSMPFLLIPGAVSHTGGKILDRWQQSRQPAQPSQPGQPAAAAATESQPLQPQTGAPQMAGPQTVETPGAGPQTPEQTDGQQVQPQPGGWESKTKRKEAQERQLYEQFYSDPSSAIMWAEQNPDGAKKLADHRTYTVGAFQEADPDLPSLGGQPGDAALRKQWKTWVRHFVANPAHGEVIKQALAGQGGWKTISKEQPVPNHPSIETVDTPFGRFSRVRAPARTQFQPNQQESNNAQQEPKTTQPDGGSGPRRVQPGSASSGVGVSVSGQGVGQIPGETQKPEATGAENRLEPAQEQPPVAPRKRRVGDKRETVTPAPAAEPRKFSSTQINLPAEVAARVSKASKKISAADLAEEGREPEPHVTVKFGLHTDDAEAVRKLVENEPPIRVKIGKSSVFPAKEASSQRGGSEHDVVKLDVHSDDLHRLNAKIAAALEHTDTHPEYKPHVTLAYVKPGAGQKYAGMNDLEGTEATINHLVFSGKGGQTVEIPLRGKRRMGKRTEVPVPASASADQTVQPRKRRVGDKKTVGLPESDQGAERPAREQALREPANHQRDSEFSEPAPGATSGRQVQLRQNPTKQTMSTEARNKGDAESGLAAADILKTWERLFGVPLRVGGFSQRAAGIYKILPEVVRTKENYVGNLAVAAHEIAHHIDKLTGITDKLSVNSGMQAEANELRGLDYEPKNRIDEGWAEYLRHYITEDDAERLAPQFTHWFEKTWLPAHPEWAKPIAEARKQAQTYASQSVFQQVRTAIGRPGDDLSWSQRFKQNAAKAGARIEQRWVDRFAPLKHVEQEAAERGADYSRQAGAHETAMAYDLTAPAHASMALNEGVHSIRDGRKFSDGLWKLAGQLKNQEEYDEAVAYAWARHTLFMADKRPRYNTGLTPEQAKAMVDYVGEDSDKLQRYDRVARGIADYNNGLVDMLVDAGALPQADRDRMIKEYGDHYFPLERVQTDQKQQLARDGARFVNLPKPIRGRSQNGSGRAILDPFDSTVGRTLFFYGRAAKARVATRLAETLDPLRGGVEGMGGLMDRIDPKEVTHEGTIDEILRTLVEQGVVEEDDAKAMRIAAQLNRLEMPSDSNLRWFADRHNINVDDLAGLAQAAQEEPDALSTITLWRQDFTPSRAMATVMIPDAQGKPVLYELDRLLYDAVAGMDPLTFGAFGNTLRTAAKVFKAGAVNLSTGFGTSNLIRDYIEYQGRASDVNGLRSLSKPLEMAAAYAGYKARQMAGLPTNDAVIKTFEELGGKLYTRLGTDIGSRQRLRKRKLGHRTASEFLTSPEDWKDLAAEGVGALQEAIAITDAPPRLAEFEAAARRMGFKPRGNDWFDTETGQQVNLPEYARIRMANAAGEATVNFKRAGSVGRKLDAFLPFSNAAIQAMSREINLLRSFKSLANRGPASKRALRQLVYLVAMAAHGGAYWLARHNDDDYREGERYLRENYWTWGLNGKTYLRIPKPRDIGQIVANFVEASLDWMYHDDADGAVLHSMGDAALSRLPSSGGLPRGAIEALVANYDYFRGRPLVPEYLQHEPKELQFTPYTSEASKLIGRTVGKHIGLSPIQVEHLLNSASGGAYRRNVDALESLWNGEAGPEHLPFVRGVVLNRHQSRSLDDFYSELGEATLKSKLDHADGTSTPEAEAKKSRLNDYAELMTKIRQLDERDLRGRRKFKYEPYLVGLAREALGREPLEHNPSPFVAANLPDNVHKAISEFAERKAKAAVLSVGLPKTVHEGDESVEQTHAKWALGRQQDEAWIKEHQESAPVREALKKVIESKSFRAILRGEQRPHFNAGKETAEEHKRELDAWQLRRKNAAEWLHLAR